MKFRRKILCSLLLAVVLVTAACGAKDNKDKNRKQGNNSNNSSNKERVDLDGTITITGSTSVEKILHDMMDEFMAYNPDVQINYTGTGSSSGIADTITKSNDIGTSSRDLKDAEKVTDLKEVVFAYDGIAVVVNPKNPVTDLTIENLGKIYSGEITNWNVLGGKDGAIIVVSREDASGTRSAYEELIGLEDKGGLTQTATVVEGNGTIQASVAGNENAIGYVSFAFINDSVSTVKIAGVDPTPENTQAGEYSLARPFIFTYLESNASNEAKAFLEFAVTDGQEFVIEHGGITVE